MTIGCATWLLEEPPKVGVEPLLGLLLLALPPLPPKRFLVPPLMAFFALLLPPVNWLVLLLAVPLPPALLPSPKRAFSILPLFASELIGLPPWLAPAGFLPL